MTLDNTLKRMFNDVIVEGEGADDGLLMKLDTYCKIHEVLNKHRDRY